ncbi:MAG: hypothetical protein WAZ20_06410 [Methanothrix sp.]
MKRIMDKSSIDVTPADLGPNLGLINHPMLIAADHLAVPLIPGLSPSQ